MRRNTALRSVQSWLRTTGTLPATVLARLVLLTSLRFKATDKRRCAPLVLMRARASRFNAHNIVYN